MTIGEKNIFAATLNFLLNSDLISNEAFNEAFQKLELPQEYKDIGDDALDFIDGVKYSWEE
jgi:hypothetical protein